MLAAVCFSWFAAQLALKEGRVSARMVRQILWLAVPFTVIVLRTIWDGSPTKGNGCLTPITPSTFVPGTSPDFVTLGPLRSKRDCI